MASVTARGSRIQRRAVTPGKMRRWRLRLVSSVLAVTLVTAINGPAPILAPVRLVAAQSVRSVAVPLEAYGDSGASGAAVLVLSDSHRWTLDIRVTGLMSAHSYVGNVRLGSCTAPGPVIVSVRGARAVDQGLLTMSTAFSAPAGALEQVQHHIDIRKWEDAGHTSPAAVCGDSPLGRADERFSWESGYKIDDDVIWALFLTYGGRDTFGVPVSRTLQMDGCTAQVFQRQLLRRCGDRMALMNLLDPGVIPYDRVNFSRFPQHDVSVASQAPGPDTPNYGDVVYRYLLSAVPNTFNGLPVRFFQQYVGSDDVTDELEAPAERALAGLELWGFPTSEPAADPANGNFIYQRFQRGIMHFDAATQSTRAVLVGDWLKLVLIGRNVPPDLADQARGSRFWAQYCPGRSAWVCRQDNLPGTSLIRAFLP
jgi:hypothetical protein